MMDRDDLISRQEAIEALEPILKSILMGNSFKAINVMDMIRGLPSAQPGLDEWCTDCKEYNQEQHCCPRFNRVIRTAMWDVQPERKNGCWIKDERHFSIIYQYRCSECGANHRAMYDFCPTCGSDMRGGER